MLLVVALFSHLLMQIYGTQFYRDIYKINVIVVQLFLVSNIWI